MPQTDQATQIAEAKLRRVLERPLAKWILIALYKANATKSSQRMSLTDLANRLQAHPYHLLRLIKGAKKHHAVLKGFVHYPDKGKRKGFYLLPAGLLLAKCLAEERPLTKSIRKKIIAALVERSRQSGRQSPPSHRQFTPNSPSSHHQVTAKSPLPLYPSTLNPENLETLNPATASCHFVSTKGRQEETSSSHPLAETEERISVKGTEEESEKHPLECERCGRRTLEPIRFNFNWRPELIPYLSSALRYRCAKVCRTCHQELFREVKEAWKMLLNLKTADDPNEA